MKGLFFCYIHGISKDFCSKNPYNPSTSVKSQKVYHKIDNPAIFRYSIDYFTKRKESRRGGTGRHARLKIVWRNPCRFDSDRRHNISPMQVYFDLLITIGLVSTLLPAGFLYYSAKKRIYSFEYRHTRLTYIAVYLLLGGASILLYGGFVEPRLLITQERTIDLEHIKHPFTIALVSDFQLGVYHQTDHVSRIVERILSLHPDIVMLAGDQLDNTPGDTDETAYIIPLTRLIEAGIPVYAIPGNHEYGVGGKRDATDPDRRFGDISASAAKAFSDLGITYMENTLVTTTVQGQDIALFGGDSYLAEKLSFDVLRDKPTDIPTLALIHNPGAVWIATKQDIDLMLSGHTHGGQIRLPFFGPIGRLNEAIPLEWYQGLHQVDADTQLFVTSGTGESGPRARLFNPPEVVLLTIE